MDDENSIVFLNDSETLNSYGKEYQRRSLELPKCSNEQDYMQEKFGANVRAHLLRLNCSPESSTEKVNCSYPLDYDFSSQRSENAENFTNQAFPECGREIVDERETLHSHIDRILMEPLRHLSKHSVTGTREMHEDSKGLQLPCSPALLQAVSDDLNKEAKKLLDTLSKLTESLEVKIKAVSADLKCTHSASYSVSLKRVVADVVRETLAPEIKSTLDSIKCEQLARLERFESSVKDQLTKFQIEIQRAVPKSINSSPPESATSAVPILGLPTPPPATFIALLKEGKDPAVASAEKAKDQRVDCSYSQNQSSPEWQLIECASSKSLQSVPLPPGGASLKGDACVVHNQITNARSAPTRHDTDTKQTLNSPPASPEKAEVVQQTIFDRTLTSKPAINQKSAFKLPSSNKRFPNLAALTPEPMASPSFAGSVINNETAVPEPSDMACYESSTAVRTRTPPVQFTPNFSANVKQASSPLGVDSQSAENLVTPTPLASPLPSLNVIANNLPATTPEKSRTKYKSKAKPYGPCKKKKKKPVKAASALRSKITRVYNLRTPAKVQGLIPTESEKVSSKSHTPERVSFVLNVSSPSSPSGRFREPNLRNSYEVTLDQLLEF